MHSMSISVWLTWPGPQSGKYLHLCEHFRYTILGRAVFSTVRVDIKLVSGERCAAEPFEETGRQMRREAAALLGCENTGSSFLFAEERGGPRLAGRGSVMRRQIQPALAFRTFGATIGCDQ